MTVIPFNGPSKAGNVVRALFGADTIQSCDRPNSFPSQVKIATALVYCEATLD